MRSHYPSFLRCACTCWPSIFMNRLFIGPVSFSATVRSDKMINKRRCHCILHRNVVQADLFDVSTKWLRELPVGNVAFDVSGLHYIYSSRNCTLHCNYGRQWKCNKRFLWIEQIYFIGQVAVWILRKEVHNKASHLANRGKTIGQKQFIRKIRRSILEPFPTSSNSLQY